MKTYLKLWLIGFLISNIFIDSCSESNKIKRKIEEFKIVDELEINSDWNYKIVAEGSNNICELLIDETVGDTNRKISLQLSLSKDFPEYFDNVGFQYLGETYKYYDSDSNLHLTSMFYSDTLYSLISRKQVNGTYNLHNYDQLVFIKGEDFYKERRNIKSWKSYRNIMIIGEWLLKFNDIHWLLSFTEDSLSIVNQITNELLYNDNYKIINDKIFLKLRDEKQLIIKDIYDFHLKIEYEGKILYSNRVGFCQ